MIVTSMVVMLLANVGPVHHVDGMSCFGYCSRCDTIHTLPTTSGAKKAASILRRKILPSMTHYLNHNNNKYDISLPDRWWIENENQIETGVENKKNQNESFELELDSQLETELLLDGASSASASSSFSSPVASSSNSSLPRILRPPIRRGKMIGVIEVYNTTSQDLLYLAGYAGKLNGHWRQPGWVSPIVVPEQVPAFVQCATKVTQLTTHIQKLEQEIIEQELTLKTNNITTTHSDTITTATAPTAIIPAATTMIRMKMLQSERKKYATEGLRSLQQAQVVSNFRQLNESTAIPNAYNSNNISGSTNSSSSSSSNEKRRRRKDRRKIKKKNRRQLWKNQQQQQQQQIDESVLVDTNINIIAPTATTNIHINATTIHMASNSTSTSRQQQQTTASHNNTHHHRRIMNMPPTRQQQNQQHKKQRLVPGGVGDCAAPKLLNAIHVINNAHLTEQQQQQAEVEAFAAKSKSTLPEAAATATVTPLKSPLPLLIPLGIAEIFVGPTGGMSTQKYDGRFYDSCPQRCQPIMGYLLCGLEELLLDDIDTL